MGALAPLPSFCAAPAPQLYLEVAAATWEPVPWVRWPVVGLEEKPALGDVTLKQCGGSLRKNDKLGTQKH